MRTQGMLVPWTKTIRMLELGLLEPQPVVMSWSCRYCNQNVQFIIKYMGFFFFQTLKLLSSSINEHYLSVCPIYIAYICINKTEPILKKKNNRSFLFNIKLYRSLVMYILLKWMWELDSHSRDRMAKSYIWINLYGNYVLQLR